MRRAALIYNPASGQRPAKRAALIADVLAVFRTAGVDITAIPTIGPNSAELQAQEAVRAGCDTVIACGGDGTAHEVLQGLVGGPAALGVIPMGTANALATDLGLPSSPVRAAKRLLNATPVRVSVGRVRFCTTLGPSRSRYFVVAAGVGADAQFFERLDSRLKQRLGYVAYVVEAFRMWATHTFPMFSATFQREDSDEPRVEEVSQLLAVRISNFGGLVHNLVPGAALNNSNLRTIAFKTRSRIRYLGFMLSAMFGRSGYSQTIQLVESTVIECSDLANALEPTFVEADGELLGTLPARFDVVPDSLSLLIPPKMMGRTHTPSA